MMELGRKIWTLGRRKQQKCRRKNRPNHWASLQIWQEHKMGQKTKTSTIIIVNNWTAKKKNLILSLTEVISIRNCLDLKVISIAKHRAFTLSNRLPIKSTRDLKLTKNSLNLINKKSAYFTKENSWEDLWANDLHLVSLNWLQEFTRVPTWNLKE